MYNRNKTTIWNVDDLEEMRKIGQKFIDIFFVIFKNMPSDIKKILKKVKIDKSWSFSDKTMSADNLNK